MDILFENDELDMEIPLIDEEEDYLLISLSDILKGQDGFSPIAHVEEIENGARITITDKEGTTIAEIFNGKDGIDGKDATINGVSTLNLVAGENIILEQEGSTLNINSKMYDDTLIQTNIETLEDIVGEHDRDIINISNEIVSIQEENEEMLENINHLDDTKADRDDIPDVSGFVTKTVNDLTNYYLKTETYTKAEVNQLVGAIKTISMKIVPERPQTGETNIIYLVPSSKATTENIYDEYVYIDNKWEIIGSTAIDLSDYYTIEQINTLLFDYITSNDLETILQEYALKEDIPDVSEFITDTEVEEKLDNYVETDTFNTLVEKVAEIELFKFPNAIIHGEPTINNGQVSNFSNENYLSLPAVFNLHDRGFEFNFAFRTGNDVTTAQNILGSKFCMALYIQNSKIRLRVSSNGSSWDLVDEEGNIDILPNALYYIQIYYDKLTYKLRYSLDGTEYTDIASRVASTPPYPSQLYLGIGNNFHNPFKGIINLNKCNLKINRSIVWAGMDTAGLETRLAVDMENIDEAGIEKIDEIVTDKGYIKKDYVDEKTKDIEDMIGRLNDILENRLEGDGN